MYHTWMVWECTFCSNQTWQPFPFIEHNMCGIGPSPTMIWNSQLRFSRLYIPQSGCNAQEDEDVPPLLHRRSNMLTEQPRNPQGCRYNVCHSQDQPCNSKRIIFTLDFKLAVLSQLGAASLTSLVDIEIRVKKKTQSLLESNKSSDSPFMDVFNFWIHKDQINFGTPEASLQFKSCGPRHLEIDLLVELQAFSRVLQLQNQHPYGSKARSVKQLAKNLASDTYTEKSFFSSGNGPLHSSAKVCPCWLSRCHRGMTKCIYLAV